MLKLRSHGLRYVLVGRGACADPRRCSRGAGAVERGARPVHDRPPRRCPRRHRRHGPRRGGRPPSPRDPRRRQLSKSATKAPIGPERTRRNVDIPRFSSPPIPTRGAFVADLDTTPPRPTPQAPPAPLGRPQNNLPEPERAGPGSHEASSARQNPPQLARCDLSSHHVSSA